MSVTRNDIAARALRACGFNGLNRKPTTAQNNVALQSYDEVYAELEELGLVEWSSTENVPNKYAKHVVNLTAIYIADELVVPAARYSILLANASVSEKSIRRLIVGNFVYSPAKIEHQ